ncbi:MAG: sodium-dependent transporter [Sphingobacteriales bacterium]|jgi:NSS family neurotransmitter:Na+ symporter|nr:sodium-dependent transporter [Sphingobacteriales bacterium]MBP9142813.1 sodium-dependent transporter [Chitinophagales bacterium]MDA0197363.1 sodium-dependent transporter [Bacteroidota bacterium]MBK6888687.1 sodium-dependent transporter [Sphingobacteriales bacterium]MBK7528806.1 sodium-dependent transporter [Sphingobacteriales bacterium]
MTTNSTNNEAWGSRVGLVLAMAGNAVGLGNFLRFPVQAIQNGGGSFIIPYLVCFLLMGIPLLFVEWSMGRYGGKHGHHSTPFILAAMGGKQRLWKYIGVFGIFTNLAVAAYYCYLESWTLGYIYQSVMGEFGGKTAEQVGTMFDGYVSLHNMMPIIFWLLCLLLNTYILSRGLSGGVEVVARIGMPLLIIFGIFLAIKAVMLTPGVDGAVNPGTMGLNFLWTPDLSSIWSPKVWLAAAGQIFFTLSVGMGSIQCYASYVRANDDIALNSMSAGWMNEFVEVVLGSAIIIPISVGYLGIDKVIELTQNGGLGLGFRTLPYLFQQWGPFLALISSVMWFGLLFFAGITSSLAMGTPCMGFMQDEFGWKREPSAWAFGAVVLVLGLPTVLFFNEGVFDEFDYWAGTVSLVVFALFEIILFAWIFGINKGWDELNRGADIKIPEVFKIVIKYITPLFLLAVFVFSLPDLFKKITDFSSPYVVASRLLLLAVFVGVAYLVRVAYYKRLKQGRPITTE